ncbi:MAG TPA: hypothetical protein VFY26_08745 [Anaerolineales bacterium]|nr:hypothetical protein [Anaerolineales bacterium]
MKPDNAPTIYSFIIRFVVEEMAPSDGVPTAYHGAIRHIQSAEEMNFNEWQEAVEFLQRFVPIDDPQQNRPTDEKKET